MTHFPPITEGLPPLYQAVVPLSPQVHGETTFTDQTSYNFAAKTPTMPLTLDEFAAAQRHYPIVFTRGDNPMPVVLMSLDGTSNPNIEADGGWKAGAYVPAYARRYPFMLIRQTTGGNDFSLCVDEASAALSSPSGAKLFEAGRPTRLTQSILDFCTTYERSQEKTFAFGARLAELGLFTETSVRVSMHGKTLELKGFKVISEARLRELDGEVLVDLVSKGWIGAIYAHLLSLGSFGDLGDTREVLAALKTSGPAN